MSGVPKQQRAPMLVMEGEVCCWLSFDEVTVGGDDIADAVISAIGDIGVGGVRVPGRYRLTLERIE